MTNTANETPAAILEAAEAAIGRIYAFLDAPDLSDAEEADALRDLKLVVQRRDAARFMLEVSK